MHIALFPFLVHTESSSDFNLREACMSSLVFQMGYLVPLVFTKVVKPLFSFLRGKGILLVGYIDDIIIIADSKEALGLALDETIAMITNLGFTIHYDKSSLVPSQQARFLGFLINSVTMEVHMTSSIQKCKTYSGLPKHCCEVASVVGSMVSSFPVVRYRPVSLGPV